MDAFEAIFTRFSVPVVRPDPVPREMLEQLLSAAVQAPNHFRVRPWRFYVLQGDARIRLGDAMARGSALRQPETTEGALEQLRVKALRAPVVIVVAVDPPCEPKVIEVENLLAVGAAIENMLIAVNALGLGAMWRTGPAAYDPEVKAFLGLPADQQLAGFIYIGFPAGEVQKKERPGFEDRTVWMDNSA